MCRWLQYQGPQIPLATLITEPENSLLDEALGDPKGGEPTETTNADGFGVGFYTSLPEPGIFRTVHPAWSDPNLHNLCAHINSRNFMAHVRDASPGMAVQESNTQPFSHGKWLFCHNGEINGFENGTFRRDIFNLIDDGLFNAIKGTTDSELMFYLALSLGLDKDPIAALVAMVTNIEQLGGMHGVNYPVNATIGLSDGKDIYAVRYASNGHPPSLFHTNDAKSLGRISPRLAENYSQDMRIVSSEPVTGYASGWTEVPRGTVVKISGFDVETRRFRP
jgi:predicted glutamine amidotransferase